MPQRTGKPRRALKPYLRLRTLEKARYRCQHCRNAGRLEVDHILPVSEGGTDESFNLQALCPQCHLAKHDKTPPSDSFSASRQQWRIHCKALERAETWWHDA